MRIYLYIIHWLDKDGSCNNTEYHGYTTALGRDKARKRVEAANKRDFKNSLAISEYSEISVD